MSIAVVLIRKSDVHTHTGHCDEIGVPCAAGNFDVFEAMFFFGGLPKDMSVVWLNIWDPKFGPRVTHRYLDGLTKRDI